MATMKFLENRICGKKAEIEKIKRRYGRIEKAAASGWEENPYFYSESDLKWARRDLDNARSSLAKYEFDYKSAIEKLQRRNVPAITEFLDTWYEKCVGFFLAEKLKYDVELKEYHNKNSAYCEWHNHGGWKDPNKEQIKKDFKNYEKSFNARWVYVTQFSRGSLSWEENMKSELQNEYGRKYDFIIERTNEIVGKITDTNGLRVGKKGDLNGIVLGEKGSASVVTFGAGGYNVQCFHFRTTIKPV